MAINVYRLQPCLRGSWRARVRRLVFFCSLCHLIWVPLAAIFAAFASPPLHSNLSQAPTPLFNDTATSLVNTDDDEFSIEHVTWNEHFNYTGLIIAVQVHNRPQYYHNLINSLRQSWNIEHAHLVISADYASPEMRRITMQIDFCRVTQIYYPLSAAFYHNAFPADSPDDCRRDHTTTKCHGTADTYGNYREAAVVNIKHHWWWKLNFIRQHYAFQHLVLLEEDHVVTPDFITTIDMMKTTIKQKEPFLMTLGTYKSRLSHLTIDWRQLIGSQFNSGKHNMGMVLSTKLVDTLTSAAWAGVFCAFDDYNWDWSLMATITQQMQRIRVFYPLVARVYHLGDTCGVHHAESNCDGASAIGRFKEGLFDFRHLLFAPDLSEKIRQMSETKTPRKIKPNGGWADERDIRLCQHFQRETSHESLLELRDQIVAEMEAFMNE